MPSIYMPLKKIFVFFSTLSLLLSACSAPPSKQVEAQNAIKALEAKVATNIETVDYNLANDLATSYMEYAFKYNDDSLAANYLFKAASLQKGALGEYKDAIETLQNFIKNYPKDQNVPKAYFFIGTIYQDNLKEFGNAQTAYQTYLEKYPNDTFAKDARILIENISLTDEELLKKITQKKDSL